MLLPFHASLLAESLGRKPLGVALCFCPSAPLIWKSSIWAIFLGMQVLPMSPVPLTYGHCIFPPEPSASACSPLPYKRPEAVHLASCRENTVPFISLESPSLSPLGKNGPAPHCIASNMSFWKKCHHLPPQLSHTLLDSE